MWQEILGPARNGPGTLPEGAFAAMRRAVPNLVVPVLLLLLGGVSLDLWAAASVRARLAAVADDAATAGATALDDGALRAGEVRLDPSMDFARTQGAEIGRAHV